MFLIPLKSVSSRRMRKPVCPPSREILRETALLAPRRITSGVSEEPPSMVLTRRAALANDTVPKKFELIVNMGNMRFFP